MIDCFGIANPILIKAKASDRFIIRDFSSNSPFQNLPQPQSQSAAAPMRVVKRVVVYPSGFSFQATLAARSATEWSEGARASGGVPDPT
jgi:hypothetical protein